MITTRAVSRPIPSCVVAVVVEVAGIEPARTAFAACWSEGRNGL